MLGGEAAEDDGQEEGGDADGLEDGVGELELHLAAAGFGVAEIAETHGEAAKFAGDLAEAVAAAPLDAMLEVALGDFAGVAGEDADGILDGDDGGDSDDDCCCGE